jgi:lipopolysaccharide export system permease protein
MTEKLMRLSRLLSGVGASFIDIAEIIIYIQPQILIFTIPMSLLLSGLLTYGRLSTDNELVVMKASGLSFKGISLPSIFLGILCFGISIFINFYFSPITSSTLREKISEIITSRAPQAIEEGIFNTDFKGFVILIKEKPAPNSFRGIFMLDERDKMEQRIIFSKEGKILSEMDSLIFSLMNGHVYVTKKDSFTDIAFERYFFRLNPTLELPGKKKSELTPFELLRESSNPSKDRISYLIEFYRRLSMPSLCLLIMLLGPSLSLLAGRTGKLGGLIIGLLVFVVYYSLMLYGESVAKAGKINPVLGSWFSFILLAFTSIVIFLKVNRK